MQPNRESANRLTSTLLNGRNTLKLVVVQFLILVVLVAALAVADNRTASSAAAAPDTTTTPMDDPNECYHWVGQPCTIYPHP